MIVQIDDYDIDYIILDLGFDVNILTRHTWESMGNPRLVQSPVQLRLTNQSKVFPIGPLTYVLVEIEGLHIYAYFDVIGIVDDTNLYPALLGTDWAIYNQTIINFKMRVLTFEDAQIRVVTRLDRI